MTTNDKGYGLSFCFANACGAQYPIFEIRLGNVQSVV